MARDFLRNVDYIKDLVNKQKLEEEEGVKARSAQNQRRRKEAFLRYQQHLQQQFAMTYGSNSGSASD
tara:strand:+ start:10299 stop:10499 length:201 start_codon:yes stop_codon:yes gene_type:complete